ncbi:MAG: hypothetical protein ACI934_001166 [Pseudohongiellaceae bacterium]|jgi:hypothetical protein
MPGRGLGLCLAGAWAYARQGFEFMPVRGRDFVRYSGFCQD